MMRGASAESLATLTESLGAAVAEGADTGRLAEDLFGVSGLLAVQPSLRRVVTDLSVTSEAKSALVRSVLADKVSASALDLVAQAAGLRWAATRDLGDALEELGVISLVQGADREGQADRLEAELFAFERLLVDNPELRDALSDPSRSVEDKRRFLTGLLEGKASSATVRLAEQTLAGTHRNVIVAVQEFERLAASHRHRLVGTVKVARPLSDADRGRLESALSSQYGRPVHLNVVVDPAVIGGVRVELGDDVIDGTVASRLDDARRRLAG
jgi:F-type H+-transporting ATPase subunit delta